MRLFLPKDTDKPEEQNKVKASGALTIMLGKSDQVYYYAGDDPTKIQATNFKDIRGIIIDKKKSTDEKDFVVVIKPTPDATFKNTVDMLDEMSINEVKRYAMVDISADEYQLVRLTEQANGIK